jgi:hypothetical protein
MNITGVINHKPSVCVCDLHNAPQSEVASRLGTEQFRGTMRVSARREKKNPA